MREYEVTITCAMCSDRHATKIVLPEGWAGAHGGVDDERGLCPRHAKIAAFKDAQCPGCVGGWADCGLWDAFAYSHPPRHARALTEADFGLLRLGACPRRTNGTFGVDMGTRTVEDIDLSEPSVQGGIALADAIVEYQNTYTKKTA